MSTPEEAAGAPAPCPRRRTTPRIRIAPAQKAQERPDLDRHWRARFLSALARTSNVTAASAAAGIHPDRAYKVRRAEPEFARLWSAALCEGYENLELEMLRRMREGEARDGPRFDNGAALRLLSLHRETVARERALRAPADIARIRASIDAKLDEVRKRVLAREAAEREARQREEEQRP